MDLGGLRGVPPDAERETTTAPRLLPKFVGPYFQRDAFPRRPSYILVDLYSELVT